MALGLLPGLAAPGGTLRYGGVPGDQVGLYLKYGAKVSFWGSGTLKIVIYVENSTPRNDVFGWLIITPSGGGGC